jgi:cell division protein FtsL
MATWAAAAKAQATAPEKTRPKTRPKPRPNPRPARRSVPRPRVAGFVWIVALTVLLAGVVAMNVAVLRLNITLDRLGRAQADLRATNADLNSRISSNAAAPRIETIAVKRLGYAPATPDQTTYVRLGR